MLLWFAIKRTTKRTSHCAQRSSGRTSQRVTSQADSSHGHINESRSGSSKSGISDRFCANLMMYGKRRTALRPEGKILLRVLSACARTSRLSSLRKLSANARFTSDKTIWFPNLPSLARQSSTWLSNIQILKRVLLSPSFKNLINSRAQRCHKLLSEVAVKEIDANSRKVRPCKAGIPSEAPQERKSM